jgi:hypothetical protein
MHVSTWSRLFAGIAWLIPVVAAVSCSGCKRDVLSNHMPVTPAAASSDKPANRAEPRKSERLLSPKENSALTAAKKYIGTKREIASHAISHDGDRIVVHLWFKSGALPQDGNDCMVYVGKNGKVVDYFEGF